MVSRAFWLSQDSNVTPPVCLAAFTAAAIAKTPPMQTGFYSWKLAKGLYIVPILVHGVAAVLFVALFIINLKQQPRANNVLQQKLTQ